MTVATGTRFDHYEVMAPLGKGGMGEVLRARDTRLNREVAIKVLPGEVAHDTERLRRFEQEAMATSALNHPNILTVYDFGNYEGNPYLVMELLDGEELRAQLDEGALPMRKVIDYAQQIAAGLAAAHDKGIVHRDLKPENLFITNDGRVKILDFGLAKLRPPRNVSAGSDVATMKQHTNPGTVMGTVAYMSPEQVRGQDLDFRSDIFSFGIILYEMLSGRRTFTGESQVEVMNAILKEDPPELSSAKISHALDKIVRRCLEKKLEMRFHSAHDLGFALRTLTTPNTSGDNRTEAVAALTTTATKSNSSWRERFWMIATGVLGLALLVVGLTWFSRNEPEAQAIRFSFSAPEKTKFAGPSFALSPDGRVVVFSADDANGKTLLYVRPLNSLTSQPLLGTERGMFPFWSPDSKSIGFFSEGKLKRMDLSGGPPQTICEANLTGGGAWNQNGEIIFAQTNQKSFSRISLSGGVPVPLTTLAPGETYHYNPQFLPDSQHFIYFVSSNQPAQRGIYVSSLSGGPAKLILNTGYIGVYGAGHLLFARNGALMGQAFDVKSLKLTGEPFLIADNIKVSSFSDNYYSLSETSSLVFQSGGLAMPQLVWFDRNGKQLGTVGDAADYSSPSLSPDGKRLAIGIRDPQTKKRDIWLFDLLRGTKSRFTFDPADDLNPIWTPDGSRILFTSDRKGQRDLFQKKVNATEEEELLYTSSEIKNTEDLSPDGLILVFNTNPGATGTTKNDLWLLPLTGERRPTQFIKTQFSESLVSISPDGKWLAYCSDESGKDEIYVTTFPQPTGKWQVSSGGGAEPKWRRDGKELYFIAGDKKLMAAEVITNSDAFETSVPKVLLETPFYNGPGRNRFVVTGDGQQFLSISQIEDAAAASLNVVINWKRDIKR